MIETDDKALEEYLSRGSEVSRRYQELGDAEVPADLDRQVLAQAHEAVSGTRSKSRQWIRWSGPLALAASIVLVASIVIESNRTPEQPDAVATQAATAPAAAEFQREEPAAVMPSEAPPPPVLAKAQAPAPMSPAVDADRQQRRESATPERAARQQPAAFPVEAPAVQEAVAQADKGPPAPAPERDSVPTFAGSAAVLTEPPALPVEVATSRSDPMASARASIPATEIGTREREPTAGQVGVVAGGRSDNMRALSPAPRYDSRTAGAGAEVAATAKAEQTAADAVTEQVAWLTRIRDLRKAGKVIDADQEWKRFVEQFPDYPVAENDAARPAR